LSDRDIGRQENRAQQQGYPREKLHGTPPIIDWTRPFPPGKQSRSRSLAGQPEADFTRNQIGDGDEIAKRAVPAQLGLCGLDEAVDALDQVIGDFGLERIDLGSG
jgi:hypothetical protein